MTGISGARIAERLVRHPVIASLYGLDMLGSFLAGPGEVAIGANVALAEVDQLVGACSDSDRFLFVNADNCGGLAQDRRGIEHLRHLGVNGVLSTRGSLVQQANSLGMVTMQKVFVTDRSTLPRSVNSIQQSKPHFTQLMPWPVLSRLSREALDRLGPFVAAGFVQSRDDVAEALACGASAVSTSDSSLWAFSQGHGVTDRGETARGGGD